MLVDGAPEAKPLDLKGDVFARVCVARKALLSLPCVVQRMTTWRANLHSSQGASGEVLNWQKAVQERLFRGAEIDRQREEIRLFEANAAQAVDEMKAKGFAALYVNRNGYPDGAKGLRETLAKLGYTEVIDSPAGDLMAVVLRKGG
jgi:hypothetical protein